MNILKLDPSHLLWQQTIDYAEHCSWRAGKHLAKLMQEEEFDDFEAVFILVHQEKICGFCTLSTWDYSPERVYSPWVTTIFVEEAYRGKRLSKCLIEEVEKSAKRAGFPALYIQSNHIGLYEKFGFEKINTIKTYDDETDFVFEKKL